MFGDGVALPGLDGLLGSHRQAERARGMALAMGSAAGGVVSADDPGFATAAMLGEDLEQTRGCSWGAVRATRRRPISICSPAGEYRYPAASAAGPTMTRITRASNRARVASSPFPAEDPQPRRTTAGMPGAESAVTCTAAGCGMDP